LEKYDPAVIEKRWQDEWAKLDLYRTTEDTSRPKDYRLEMFP